MTRMQIEFKSRSRSLLFLFFYFLLSFLDICYCTPGFEPQQVHISTGSFDQMIILWNTVNNTDDSLVLYGKGRNISQQQSGLIRKFVDPGPLHRVQYIHKVILTGLDPKTEYSYKVGSQKHGVYSDIFSFKTWPEGNEWSPRLAIYGDLGKENAQSLPRLEADVLQGLYDSILHVGDFAYDMHNNNGEVGDGFMRQIEPLAASLPYMTCPGNHEEAYDFFEYRNRFEMPGDEIKRMYFSYTMGPIRFISLATELIFYPQYGLAQIVEQYEWLEAELKKANSAESRAKQPWVITYGHRPMYCSNNNTKDCTHHESLVRVGIPYLHILGWEELFYKYKVDVAIWAHQHSYERLWPVYNREVRNGSYEHPYTNPKAPVHVITGSAGNKEDHDFFPNKTAPWSAFRSKDYGYARMMAYNATHLSIEQVSDDKGGKVIDRFMIIKDKQHKPFPYDPRPVKPFADSLEKQWKNLKHLPNVFQMNIPQ